MMLTLLKEELAICRLDHLPKLNYFSSFLSFTKTKNEISLVCPMADIPDDCKASKWWRGFMVEGPLDFGLTGILSKLSLTLADAKIPIFALSTYDTDYVLVRSDRLIDAIRALNEAGYELTEE